MPGGGYLRAETDTAFLPRDQNPEGLRAIASDFLACDFPEGVLGVAGPCKPPEVDYSSINWGKVKIRAAYREMPRPGPRLEVPRAESMGMVWLPWESIDGRLRGLRRLKVKPDGTIIEPEKFKPAPRRKRKWTPSERREQWATQGRRG